MGRQLVLDKWPECPGNILRLIESHHNPAQWFPAQLLATCDVWIACHENRIYRCIPLPESVIHQEMLRVAPASVINLVLEVATLDLTARQYRAL